MVDLEAKIGVSYKTLLRMRDIIQRAASKHKGYQTDFGAWPRSFMKRRSTTRVWDYKQTKQRLLAEGKHPSQHVIRSLGVLSGFVQQRTTTAAALKRTECLLRLLLVSEPAPRKRLWCGRVVNRLVSH